MTTEEKPDMTRLPMIQPPFKFEQGRTYQLLMGEDLRSVRLEKIMLDLEGNTMLMLTRLGEWKGFLSKVKDHTFTMPAADFKLRVVKGGLKEILL